MGRQFAVVTVSPEGNQHLLPWHEGLRFGSNYPGGYAACSLRVPYPLARAYLYGLGQFWRLQVWDGLSQVWDGEIRRLDQGESGWLEVEAYGHGVILKDAPYLRMWQDTRFGSWEVERPARSEAWEVENDKRLAVTARLPNHYFQNGDRGSLLFRLPQAAHHPEPLRKVTATVSYNLGSSGGGAGSWQLAWYALNDNGATISAGAGEINPKVIATSGKATDSAISWATDDGSNKMPAATRQLRLALESLANQVLAPNRWQEDAADVTYFRQEDVPAMANNMVVNPSVENWPQSVTDPISWIRYGTGLTGAEVGNWKKHEYVSWGVGVGDPISSDSGIRQDITVVAQTQYYISVWCKPIQGTLRLKCSNNDDTNMTTIASSTGTAEQKLSGTYTVPVGKTVLRLWLELVFAGGPGAGAFDMAWVDDASGEPATYEDYYDYSWGVADNNEVNNFENDYGKMTFEETYIAHNCPAAGNIPSSTHKGWRAKIRWEGTQLKIYGMRAVNFGLAYFQTFDEVDNSMESQVSFDYYGSGIADHGWKKLLYTSPTVTRGRYYTVLTSRRERNALVTTDPVAVSLDYYVPQGWTMFQTSLADLQVTVSAITVATTISTTATANDVASDIASDFSATGLGLSSSTVKIASGSTRNLLPISFLDDSDGQAVLESVLAQGDQNNKPLTWAVWNDKALVVEPVVLSAVGYHLRPERCRVQRSAEVSEIVLKAYGVYQDEAGVTQRSSVQTSANSAALFGSRYRAAALQLPPELVLAASPKREKYRGTMPTPDVDVIGNYVSVWLAEHDDVLARSQVTVSPGGILSADGAEVPLSGVRAGKLAQVLLFGAPSSGPDLRDGLTTAMVVATDYSAEAEELTLTLGGDYYNIAEMIAR